MYPKGNLMIPASHGQLEGILKEPAGGRRGVALVCHPHPLGGGTMHNKVVFRAAAGLVDAGLVTLRFNFRGVGSSAGAFDNGRGEVDDFRAALNEMHERYPEAPLWAAGFSFGSWIALETGATDPRVSALIAVAPPVARDGYDFSNTLESTKPKFFVQGELDELCSLKELRAFYARCHEPKEMVVIDGATHLFDGQGREVGEALEDLLGDFS
jgi:hypothetical protein